MSKCSAQDKYYFYYEFIAKNVPSVIFICTGYLNFHLIRPLSFSRMYKFSLLFKIKLFTSWLLMFVNIGHVILQSSTYSSNCLLKTKSKTAPHDDSFEKCVIDD